MHSIKALPALVAIGAHLVAAQDRACTTATYTITDLAQATNIPCRTMEGSIEIDGEVSGDLVIEGPSRIKGSLVITNATTLNSLASSSLSTIDESFILHSLEMLSSVNMPRLNDIKAIDWVTLPRLETVRLGEAGVSAVESIKISDTSLRDLDNFNVASVNTMDINNNWRLSSYSSQLANVSERLTFQSNGDETSGLNITLDNLVWAKVLEFNQVSGVKLPVLSFINDSLRFDLSPMGSFSAPNLTEIGSGDLSFLSNKLEKLTFPLLTRIGGSLTLVNNTGLAVVDGFPELEYIGGAVRMGGDFTEVELPKLDNAAGGFQILSTEDITETCDSFDSQEGRQIQGVYRCSGKEDEANNEDSFTGNGGNGGSSNNDSAAGLVSTNMVAIVAAAAIGILAQL